ncbi:hypothetical protein PHYPSEUDO_003718 [Phytophthora pseudosyringae]|uniref:Ankyrin repeat protein n=1 Tax=Phytophthora pseudosyringae TaxID=221518 RepID=A0A8T1V200_9STRA|nr:hypothetical protein PHYPSEUDO_003718 [Phytophthora pseudosyringae]
MNHEIYLYSNAQESTSSLVKVLEELPSTRIVKLLRTREQISRESFIRVFQDATRFILKSRHLSYDKRERISLIAILCKEGCVPLDVDENTFQVAAPKRSFPLVKVLLNDSRLSSAFITENLVSAVERGHVGMADTLYKKLRTSCDLIVEEFIKAATDGNIELIKYLSVKREINRETRLTALASAAMNGRDEVVKALKGL